MNEFPEVFRVRQTFEAPQVSDVDQTVREQLSKLSLQDQISAGQSVALTAGSRGIHQIGAILKAAVRYFLDLGAEPFIVPAMGSHGGGTAEGQLKVLESLGVTESFCGCPIRSSMDTVIVCESREGFPVHFDQLASEADHVVVCNRVKPHTRFTGDLQSGLMKMMLIGLGKRNGAEVYHQAIMDYTFGQIVRSVAQEVLGRCRIVAGLAIVENGYDETALIEAIAPAEVEAREAALLHQSQQWMAKLPFEAADLLLINKIGKNISGTGMDTNVVGRKQNDHLAANCDERPRIRYIIMRGLTAATHGNATGIGIAEFTLRRVVDQIDAQSTATNCITANHPTGAMVPICFETDHEVLSAAMGSIGLRAADDVQMMWIEDTLKLAELECSAAYWQEARSRDDLEILTDPRPMPFGTDGNLPESFPAD